MDLKINDYNLKLVGDNIKLTRVNGKEKKLLNLYRGQKIIEEKSLMNLINHNPKVIKLDKSDEHFITLVFPDNLNESEYLRIEFLNCKGNLFKNIDFKLK